jgi:hypothetical protein
VLLVTSKFLRFLPSALHRDRSFLPAVVLIGVALLGLQWAGGAWKAEFTGAGDEAGQFVSGRMIWEYTLQLPRQNPLAWAEQYYLHYPKVAIGHWPPGYPLAEAIWSLPFGSSRTSAMWLQWFSGLLAITGLYRLARPRFPLPVTAGIVAIAILTPVFQRSLEQTMADLACLLCGVVFMHAFMLLLRRPDWVAWTAVAVTVGAALLVKGTALCLPPAAVLAWLVSGKRLVFRRRWFLLLIPAVSASYVVWHFAGRAIAHWGGLGGNLPWPAPLLGSLAGWGFVCLAALGLRLEPLAVISGCMIFSALLVSWAMRAMGESRHWIMLLPPILILAGYAVTRFRGWVGALLAVPALVMFPWTWYRQTPVGCRDLIEQLHLPSRMMVSAGAGLLGEGSWIAEVSLAERYPASLVARGSRVLATSGWNGEHYRSLVSSREEVARILDELALDVVVLDAPEATAPVHHVLLAATVEGSAAWRACGRSKEFAAWCRTEPPRFPRKPVSAEAGGLHMVEQLKDADVNRRIR